MAATVASQVSSFSSQPTFQSPSFAFQPPYSGPRDSIPTNRRCVRRSSRRRRAELADNEDVRPREDSESFANNGLKHDGSSTQPQQQNDGESGAKCSEAELVGDHAQEMDSPCRPLSLTNIEDQGHPPIVVDDDDMIRRSESAGEGDARLRQDAPRDQSSIPSPKWVPIPTSTGEDPVSLYTDEYFPSMEEILATWPPPDTTTPSAMVEYSSSADVSSPCPHELSDAGSIPEYSSETVQDGRQLKRRHHRVIRTTGHGRPEDENDTSSVNTEDDQDDDDESGDEKDTNDEGDEYNFLQWRKRSRLSRSSHDRPASRSTRKSRRKSRPRHSRRSRASRPFGNGSNRNSLSARGIQPTLNSRRSRSSSLSSEDCSSEVDQPASKAESMDGPSCQAWPVQAFIKRRKAGLEDVLTVEITLGPSGKKRPDQFSPPARRSPGAKPRYTRDEDARLTQLKQRGTLSWDEIKEFFPNRTTTALRGHYYTKYRGGSRQS